MKLYIFPIHGIGGSSEAWAVPVIEKLQKNILKELKAVLKDKVPADISQVLSFKSVYLKTAFEKQQNELRKILAGYFGWIVRTLNARDTLFSGRR